MVRLLSSLHYWYASSPWPVPMKTVWIFLYLIVCEDYKLTDFLNFTGSYNGEQCIMTNVANKDNNCNKYCLTKQIIQNTLTKSIKNV